MIRVTVIRQVLVSDGPRISVSFPAAYRIGSSSVQVSYLRCAQAPCSGLVFAPHPTWRAVLWCNTAHQQRIVTHALTTSGTRAQWAPSGRVSFVGTS